MIKLIFWALLTAPGHWARKWAIGFLSGPAMEAFSFFALNPLPIVNALISIINSPALRLSLSVWIRLALAQGKRDQALSVLKSRREWVEELEEMREELV